MVLVGEEDPSSLSDDEVVDIRRCLGIAGISDSRVVGLGSAKGLAGSAKGFADAVGAVKTAVQAGFCPSDCAKVEWSKFIDDDGGSTSNVYEAGLVAAAGVEA